MQQRALTQLLRHWFWLSPMVLSVNQKSRTFLTDPVLTFSGNENSRSFLTIDDDVELDSFTDVAIVETTESKATKSKIKTEVEHSGSLSALADNVELDSFTDVAIDETTESKAKKSKIKTELRKESADGFSIVPTDNLVKIRVENLLSTNCKFVCNHCRYKAKGIFEPMLHRQSD